VTRWLALVAGIALVVLAFVAYTHVSDTREGQIAEVVTLVAGAAGLLLAIYWFAARERPQSRTQPGSEKAMPPALRAGSPRDLALGAGGIGLGAVLLAGLAISGGLGWAGLGFLLLLPMLAGSVYLCWRWLRTTP